MTEVPEHLLRRSRERRAALGLGGGEAPAAPAAPPAEEAPARGAQEQAAPVAAAAAAPAAPAAAPEAPAAPARPEPPRRRIPVVMAALVSALPLWGVVYLGAFGEHGKKGPVDPLVLGAQVYTKAGCAGCHGAQGQGLGSFPKLAGEVTKTFPDEADHVEWVRTGSIGKAIGTPYGDPNREGGQHTVKLASMPSFARTLSEEEILAVVKYEREGL